MTDGMIKETKNSRLIKADLPATYAEFKALIENSGLPIDLLINLAGWATVPTWLNKGNLLPDDVAAKLWPAPPSDPVIKDALDRLSGGMLYTPKTLNDLSIGDTFTLNETISGTTKAVDYILLSKNYESSGRCLVLRKDAIAPMAWNTGGTNAYANSTLDAYLNNTYFGYLDTEVQAQIENVNIPYTPGNGTTTVTTLPRKAFALSVTEFNSTLSNINTEGAAISYFTTSASRVTKYGGTAVYQWTRSPNIANTSYVSWLNAFGDGSASITVTRTGDTYARPALTLPLEFITEYHTITDLLGNELILGAQIATGSYTGTGTYGSDNPTVVTLDIVPKLMIVFTDWGYLGQSQISGIGYSYRHIIFPPKEGLHFSCYGNSATSNIVSLSDLGKTVSWYNTKEAAGQLNTSGTKYNIVAIG